MGLGLGGSGGSREVGEGGGSRGVVLGTTLLVKPRRVSPFPPSPPPPPSPLGRGESGVSGGLGVNPVGVENTPPFGGVF